MTPTFSGSLKEVHASNTLQWGRAHSFIVDDIDEFVS
jgi:hypothetical protein